VNSKPSSFKAYLLAARPKTLLAGIAPVLIGLGLTLSSGAELNGALAFLTIICTVFMQMGTNYVNDVIDAQDGVDDHTRLGPMRATQQGWLTADQVRLAYRVCFGAAFVLGLVLVSFRGIPLLILGIASLLAAYAYTAGPWPLSRMGLGEVVAFLFFGPVAVLGTYYIQTEEFSLAVLAYGLLPGIGASTLMAINNLRDRESDARHNKLTLATLLPEHGARHLPIALVILNITLCFVFVIDNSIHVFLAAIPWFIWLAIAKKPLVQEEISHKTNRFLALTGLSIFIQSLILLVLGKAGVPLLWILS
jgi:1,4-dihydroxy-2-naphthoate polyprenyltransferase